MVVQDVDLNADLDYSHDEALSLWRRCRAGDVTPEDFLLYVKRHVILRLRERFSYRLSDDECESVVQDTLMSVWRIIQKRSFPSEKRAGFARSLTRVVLHRLYQHVRECDVEEPEAFWIEGYARSGEPERSQEVGLYIADLPAMIRHGVLRHVLPARCGNPPKAKEAVRYIIDRLLNGEQVRKNWLVRHYRIPKPDFLIGYVHVRARQVLWEIASDFPHRKDQEQILHAGTKLLSFSRAFN